MNLFPEHSRRAAVWVIAIIVISTATAMVVSWRLPALGAAARDALVRARGARPSPEEVVIVAIDEASIQRFGRFPWPRSLMAQALEKLSTAQPKAIAMNVLFSDPTNEADDAALASAIQRAGNVVVAAQLIETPSRGAEWLRPLAAIEQAAAGIGHGAVLTDTDGVARSLALREANDEGDALWAMAVELMRVGEGLGAEDVRDLPEVVKIGARAIPIEAESPAITFARGEEKNQPRIFRASRMAIDYIGPAGSFADRTVSIADVIEGRVGQERFSGKYVLIGATAAAMADRVASPFGRAVSGNGRQNETLMPGVEVSANALTTILRSRFYRETPDWIAAIVAALAAAAVIVAISLAQGPYELARQLVALLGSAGVILGLCHLAFVRWMIAPPVVPAILSLVTAAPLALLLRSLTVSASLDDRIVEMTRESARLAPLAMAGGEIGAIPSWLPHGIARKANSLAELQRRLFARTQFVDRALQSVEDGLLITDLAGRIAFANPRAATIFGLPENALLGSDLFQRLNEAEGSHDGAAGETLTRLLRDRVTIEREVVVAAAEPRTYMLRMAAVSASPDGDDRGVAPLGVVATLSDITKQRELRQMQNDVMTLVTHEMKTPLTAIKGMSEVLMKFEPDAEKRRKMHATIHEASERLARMIDDYLDLTRLESGARAPHVAFHHVESLLEQTLLLLDPVAAARGMELSRRFPPDLPVVLLDSDLLARALTNLVANAIKYSPADTEVVIAAEAAGGYVFISVADRGHGIAPEHRTQIFEKFFRVPRAENADTPGTGLGLALVREIAELHGGRVTVESDVGAGSTFTLRLPLKH